MFRACRLRCHGSFVPLLCCCLACSCAPSARLWPPGLLLSDSLIPISHFAGAARAGLHLPGHRHGRRADGRSGSPQRCICQQAAVHVAAAHGQHLGTWVAPTWTLCWPALVHCSAEILRMIVQSQAGSKGHKQSAGRAMPSADAGDAPQAGRLGTAPPTPSRPVRQASFVRLQWLP